jgi:replicative DNA helicase
MVEKQLIKMLLKKDFYTENKSNISPTLFQGDLNSLYDTIKQGHNRYKDDLKIEELYSMHTVVFNPALTTAAKEKFSDIIQDIKETTEPSPDLAKDIIRILKDRDVAQKIAVEATEIFNGKEANFNKIATLIEKHKENLINDDEPPVTNEIPDVLKALEVNSRWRFNIDSLKDKIGGLGSGNLAIVFARPETGKTAFWVSLCAGPLGFARQGANIHAFINEEPAIRTQMRAISCYTGMDKDSIEKNIELASKSWIEIKNKIKMFDTVDWTLDNIDAHCEKYQPDIIVIDQLDKIGVNGKFNRTDEKLRAIYTGAREIAKRRRCLVIAISQASADAHNKDYVSFDMMENSKTGKAAEADLIIGIGRNPSVDTENKVRNLSVSKNKINGFHGEISCTIQRHISRYGV